MNATKWRRQGMGRTRHVRFGRRTQRHQADEREQHHVGEHVVHRRRWPLDSDQLLRAALVAHGDQLPDQQRELDVRLIRPIERICLLRSHSYTGTHRTNTSVNVRTTLMFTRVFSKTYEYKEETNEGSAHFTHGERVAHLAIGCGWARRGVARRRQ